LTNQQNAVICIARHKKLKWCD